MEKRLVKVAPAILDLKYKDFDNQASLFSLDESTLLKLDQNESTVTPSPQVLKSLAASIKRKSLNRHPDYSSRRLRRKLARYTGVGFDSIACFNGEASAMEAIARTYLYQGLDALISWPADNLFSHYASSTGARVVHCQFKNLFEPKIEELIAGITPKTRLIFLSNPNSITGVSLTGPEIVFLLSYAPDIMVVIDESEFEFSGLTLNEMIDEYPNLIIFRSFSKAFALAGVEVNFIMSDPENLRFVNRLGIGKHPGALAQIAAEAALDDSRYLALIVNQVDESKKMLFDNLTHLNYEFRISRSNFFLIKVEDPESFLKTLIDNNIYVKSLLNIPGFENYLRITIGTPPQTEILLDILGLIAGRQATGQAAPVNRLTAGTVGREYVTG